MLVPIQVLQEVNYLQKQWYPSALLFDILFDLKLIAEVMAETEISPALLALRMMEELLDRDTTGGDFELALRQCSSQHERWLKHDPMEVQGYVDFIALAWSTITAAVRDIPPEQMVGTLESWRQFRHLQSDVKLRSKQFVISHARWASHNLWLQSLQNVHAFLDLLLLHIEPMSFTPHYATPHYWRGFQIAHDTVLLYLDLLNWWQREMQVGVEQ